LFRVFNYLKRLFFLVIFDTTLFVRFVRQAALFCVFRLTFVYLIFNTSAENVRMGFF